MILCPFLKFMPNLELQRGERMVAILMHLLSRPSRQVSISTILEELEIDEVERRSVQRDLLALSEIPGSLVQKIGSGTRITWGVEVKTIKGLILPGVEHAMLSLLFLKRIAGIYPDMAEGVHELVDRFYEQMPSAERRTLSNWSTELQNKILFMGDPMEGQKAGSSHLSVFLRAIKDRRKVEVLYQGNTDEQPKTNIRVPVLVVLHKGEIYVGCFSQSNSEIDYYLKLRRVRKVKVLGEHYKEDPARFKGFVDRIEKCGGMLGENHPKAQRIKLRFPSYIENILKESPYHSSAKNRIEKDGSILLTLDVEVNRSLLQWVLGWADRVEVLAPKELRSQLCEAGKELVALYSR
jgi:predicted DNA-binding transcriptional regulator YafY